ncbi:hypothetical protein H4R33_000866 [Dimargaris cristalligena]|nr:hypothetical protein H4R33_000866 [Dimargaris cristalligena]
MAVASNTVYAPLTGPQGGEIFGYLNDLLHPLLYAGVAGNALCSVGTLTLFGFATLYIRRWYVHIDGQWQRLVRKRISDRLGMTCIARPGDPTDQPLLHRLSRWILRWDWVLHRIRCGFSFGMALIWMAFSGVLYRHSGAVDCNALNSLLVAPVWPNLGQGLGDVPTACRQGRVVLAMALFNSIGWSVMCLALAYMLPPVRAAALSRQLVNGHTVLE